MTIASVGSLGTVGSVTADQSTLVLTTSATLEAGNLGVIVIGVDNNQTTDGDEGAVSGVVDSAGNTWTKAAEFTNGQGAAKAGATCSVWYCRAATQLTSGGTITATFTNNTSRDAAAATAWEFTVGGTVAIEGTPGTLADDTNLTSLNVTTTNIACLRIRAAGIEGTGVAPMTVTSTWTEFTFASAGGAAGANMNAWAEFLISTGTGAASDPAASANRDAASVYVAFKESSQVLALTAAVGAFSLTGVAALKKISQIAAVGAYALTGVASIAHKVLTLIASAGAFTLTGIDGTLSLKRYVAIVMVPKLKARLVRLRGRAPTLED